MIRVIEHDPLVRPIPYPHPTHTSSILRPVPLGVFEDGTPLSVLLARRNALVGGVMGSGKSGALNVLLGGLSACVDVVLWGIDLKQGMELMPWMPCLHRLAVEPVQAVLMLRDALVELDRRAAELAARGQRLWAPTPERPALEIVVDEWAELPPAAGPIVDSIARRGRAVCVNLLAATQRPTQQAMQGGAIRSQMDIRIGLRVREPRDTDLILGQGMHTAGWRLEALDQPGKLLISDPEHQTARVSRAFWLPDDGVTTLARNHAGCRPRGIQVPTYTPPPLDSFLTGLNLDGDSHPGQPRVPTQRQSAEDSAKAREGNGPDDDSLRPGPHPPAYEKKILFALAEEPGEGFSTSELVEMTEIPRRSLHRYLRILEEQGKVVQLQRGSWAFAPGQAHRQ